MYYLTKTFKFEAAHQLVNHDGKCARLHGHSWEARVQFAGQRLVQSGPKGGMLVDYGDISKLLQPIIDQYLDHWFLNETLQTNVPTSEAVARWLYNEVATRMESAPAFVDVGLHSVTICETCTSECTYAPEAM